VKLPTLLKRLESLKNNMDQLNDHLANHTGWRLDTRGVETSIKDVKRKIEQTSK